MKNAVQTEAVALVPVQEASLDVRRLDPLEFLQQAIEKGAPVETLERLMVMRREINAERAKEAFDKALAAFQNELPPIEKKKGVPDRTGATAYKYAPFEYIVSQAKPYLQKHGFSFTLDTNLESQPGWVIAVCKVTHSAGHSETSTAKFPLGTKTGIMSDTQVYAAALSFACRRVFSNAFGIVVAGEDMDGRTAAPKPAGPSSVAAEPSVKDLAKELWALLKPVRGAEANWKQANQWLWDEGLISDTEAAPEFTPVRFRQVITAAKNKLHTMDMHS